VFSALFVPSCYTQDMLHFSESAGDLVNQLDNRWGSVVMNRCCEKLVAEVGNSSGTQRKGNVCRWKPLQSNDSEQGCGH
jgi:hypothetical protein